MMTRENAVSRRKALKVTGAAATTALVAGCGGGGGNGNGESGNGESNDSGNESGGSGEGPYEVSPDETIELRSLAQSWEGIAPASIEGVENPDLSLQEGETYTILWSENESGTHNLAVYDDSEEPVAGPTDQTDEEAPELEVEFEASQETVEYVCQPHYQVGMLGSIELQ